MPYGKLLKKVIAESDYTVKQIVEECNNRGLKIDKTYISKLQNNKCKSPSTEISKEIAKICNQDERLLVLEGEIDRAPEEIREMLYTLKLIASTLTLNVLGNSIDKNVAEEIDKQIKREPMSEFILKFIDSKENFKSMNKNIFNTNVAVNDINISLTQPLAIDVPDNSMWPLITEKSKVCLTLKTNYNDGDIIAVKVSDRENIIVRTVFFKENKVILTSLNKNYSTLTYDISKVIIMGKVTSVVNNL